MRRLILEWENGLGTGDPGLEKKVDGLLRCLKSGLITMKLGHIIFGLERLRADMLPGSITR